MPRAESLLGRKAPVLMLLKCSLYSCDHPGDARTALRWCAVTLSVNTYKDAASCFNHTMSSVNHPGYHRFTLNELKNGGRRVSRVVGVHLNKQRDVPCPCLASYNTTKRITNCWKQAGRAVGYSQKDVLPKTPESPHDPRTKHDRKKK